jgi:hypothetical protein
MEILGSLLIVCGVILGIALGCGVALGYIPLFGDYNKLGPKAARRGTMSRDGAVRPTNGSSAPAEDTQASG